ncbi:hypothetical protein HHI36_021694 [Cryptolaemus montrouzieri]|uniref:Uncharacterized protein n=1 Tax=Cryptolaemus montrouzieri TaxID=559131 RepID=A0ABD2MXG0_9CUCU
MDTAENSELEEPEDKSFVNQFIEADVKIWEQNNFVVSSKRSICKQTNNSYKFDLPKIEPRQNEEYQEISIKDEYCEDVKIDSDENRTDIPETETELSKEDSKSIVCELIDGKNGMKGRLQKFWWRLRK